MSVPRRAKPVRQPVSRTPPWVVPAAVLGGVAVLIAAFLVIRWYTTPAPPPAPSVDATQQIVAEITSLPASEFDAVGTGTADNRIKPISGPDLTGPSGKPEVFYLGAEYCPYCAAERWPIIIALSRFGTFSGLRTTTSSSTDIYPNTPTFTFHGASYASQYIDFVAVETLDRSQNRIENPTAAQEQLVTKYDTSNSIPFVDFGNRYAFAGAMYLPSALSGDSWQGIAGNLQQPDTAQARAIIGSANLITAAVCRLTGNQPQSVCASPSISAIEGKLG